MANLKAIRTRIQSVKNTHGSRRHLSFRITGDRYIYLLESFSGVAAMRLYLIEPRLYALYGASEDLKNIEQFFNSFQLESSYI